jgi:outer membrane protein assembly factor BamB
VWHPALDRHARSDGFAAARVYESGRSTLTLCFSLFVCFPLFAAFAEPQTKPLPTSSAETIAGGEPTSVLGTEFSLASVSGLAGDADGDIYFSIQARNRVYRLGPDGNVAAASSPLLDPRTLAVDAAGNVYIVCVNALVRVDGRTGVLATVFSIPCGQPGAPDSIRDILDMVVGADGDLYLSDGGDHRIKTYDFASGAVTVLAGNGTSGPTQPGVPAISSPLRYPQAVAVGSDGTVYFSTEEPCVSRARLLADCSRCLSY